ncbi:hypothetical protein [Amycolatopsis sp. NPDC004378]
MDGPLAEFATELRALRADLGSRAPTIDQISSAENIPRSTLYAALKGARLPGRDVVAALARAWGGDEAEWIGKRQAIEDLLAEIDSRRPSQALRDGSLWLTVPPERTVLVAVGNGSVERMLDVVSLLSSDIRIRVVFTVHDRLSFGSEASRLVQARGLVEIPWREAMNHAFDLIVTTNAGWDTFMPSGPLAVLSAPLRTIVPIGEKVQPSQTVPRRAIFGLAAEWLHGEADNRNARVMLGLASEADLHRLRTVVPAVVDRAQVIGDPYFDRIVESWPQRARYRQALGVDQGRHLVTVTSDWTGNALLGREPRLPETLITQLPPDKFRVALILHPNVWAAHGTWQLTQWLHDALAAGLLLVPPTDDQRVALIAADCVVGDHGSMTVYAAGLGLPVLAVGEGPHDGASMATERSLTSGPAQELDLDGDLRVQVEAAIKHTKAVSAAGRRSQAAAANKNAQVLRTSLYELMKLDPPADASVRSPVTLSVSYADDAAIAHGHDSGKASLA